MKKTSIILVIISLYLFEINAQSNWVTSNFKSYLSNGLTNEYIQKSQELINSMDGYEREKSFYALSLFKVMSGYSNERIPICQFNIATSAVNLSMSSKHLISNVSLNYCIVNGTYYFFLVNALRNDGVDVKLKSISQNSLGSISTHSVSCGAHPYSVACFKKDNNYIDFSFESYRKINSLVKSPCN